MSELWLFYSWLFYWLFYSSPYLKWGTTLRLVLMKNVTLRFQSIIKLMPKPGGITWPFVLLTKAQGPSPKPSGRHLCTQMQCNARGCGQHIHHLCCDSGQGARRQISAQVMRTAPSAQISARKVPCQGLLCLFFRPSFPVSTVVTNRKFLNCTVPWWEHLSSVYNKFRA